RLLGVLHPRPARRYRLVPAIRVVVDPVVPAPWRHPHPMDQDDGLCVSAHQRLPGCDGDPALSYRIACRGRASGTRVIVVIRGRERMLRSLLATSAVAALVCVACGSAGGGPAT